MTDVQLYKVIKTLASQSTATGILTDIKLPTTILLCRVEVNN